MRRRLATANFIRVYSAFLREHPEIEEKVEEVMERVVADTRAVAHAHSLHGKLAGFYAARVSQSYRLVFALEPDAVVFIDIGSHDDVY